MVFGQHMITSVSTYPLLRRLNLLDDRSLKFDRHHSFELMRNEAVDQMRSKHNENEKRYNIRSRKVSLVEGQEVYLYLFISSPAAFKLVITPSLDRRFIKSRVRKKIGNAYYELEDLQERVEGTYHAKDIRQ
uniref:Indora n=1 Tax=Drosophila melanogaster TaxID=7227 RepID=O62532_DROME|nr:indora [Drosophila melanogaster]